MERFIPQIGAVRTYPLRCRLSQLTIGLGKSDPYVVFTLDDQRVFKSQAKKKTLHPEWNETFSVMIVSVIPERWEAPFVDHDHFSLLVLGPTSNLRCLTGTRSPIVSPPSRPSSVGSPGSNASCRRHLNIFAFTFCHRLIRLGMSIYRIDLPSVCVQIIRIRASGEWWRQVIAFFWESTGRSVLSETVDFDLQLSHNYLPHRYKACSSFIIQVGIIHVET